jgi:hypothetical protein
VPDNNSNKINEQQVKHLNEQFSMTYDEVKEVIFKERNLSRVEHISQEDYDDIREQLMEYHTELNDKYRGW